MPKTVKLPEALGQMRAQDLRLLLELRIYRQPDEISGFLAADVRRAVKLGIVRYGTDLGEGLSITEDGQAVLNAVLTLIGAKA